MKEKNRNEIKIKYKNIKIEQCCLMVFPLRFLVCDKSALVSGLHCNYVCLLQGM